MAWLSSRCNTEPCSKTRHGHHPVCIICLLEKMTLGSLLCAVFVSIFFFAVIADLKMVVITYLRIMYIAESFFNYYCKTILSIIGFLGLFGAKLHTFPPTTLSKSLLPTDYQERGNSFNLRIVSLSNSAKEDY